MKVLKLLYAIIQANELAQCAEFISDFFLPMCVVYLEIIYKCNTNFEFSSSYYHGIQMIPCDANTSPSELTVFFYHKNEKYVWHFS